MLGEPMIYDISEVLKEYLTELNDVFVKEKEAKEAEEAKRAEEVKQSLQGVKASDKANFIPVTKESFLEWEAKFRAEMAEKQAEEEKKETPAERKERLEMEGRMTGKQFFMQRKEVDEEETPEGEEEFDIEALRKEEEADPGAFDEELFDDDDGLDDLDLE